MNPLRTVVVVLAALAAASCAMNPTETVHGAVTPMGQLIDRMGRPELANFVLRVPAVKDTYNFDDPFEVPPSSRVQYARVLREGLVALDGLDAQRDWAFYAPTIDPLVTLLLNDFLLVDPSKPCSVDTDGYLEIEKDFLEDRPHTTCGGRTPNADAIDDLMSYFVAHDRTRISDGVDRPASPATDVFPYLAPGHTPPTQ